MSLIKTQKSLVPNIGLAQGGATCFVLTFVLNLKFRLCIEVSVVNSALHQVENVEPNIFRIQFPFEYRLKSKIFCLAFIYKTNHFKINRIC